MHRVAPFAWTAHHRHHDVSASSEALRHRINHLERLRRIQEDTGRVSPHSVRDVGRRKLPPLENGGGSHGGRLPDTLAVSRLYLDNVRPHPVQAGSLSRNHSLPGRFAFAPTTSQHRSLNKTRLRRRRENRTTKANSAASSPTPASVPPSCYTCTQFYVLKYFQPLA